MRPEDVEQRLRSSLFVVRSVLFSPTWGREEAFVGSIRGNQLEMRVRHGYSNGLTRIFYGSVTPTPQGTRIEGEFVTLLFVVAILRVLWLLFIASALFEGGAMLVAAPTLLLLLAIEAVARRMGDADEEKMREFLTRSL